MAVHTERPRARKRKTVGASSGQRGNGHDTTATAPVIPASTVVAQAEAPDQIIQIRRTATANNPPPAGSLEPGVLNIEMNNPVRLWCGVDLTLDATGRKLLLNTSFGEAPTDGFIYARRGSTASWQGLTRPNDVTALGEGANTTASANVAIGARALAADTDGGWNIAIGVDALTRNTSGAANIAIGGWDTLAANTDGDWNTAIGPAALAANIDGNSNIAVGGTALISNTSGSSNIAIGVAAIRGNTVGEDNIGLGRAALFFNIDGSRNIAIGNASLQGNSSGLGNIAIGEFAVAGNTGGAFNIGIGNSALHNNLLGLDNIAIGREAGRWFGADRPDPLSATNHSVFIGGHTRSSANNQTNQIVIGYEAVGHGSNTATIGNDDIVGLYCRGTLHLGEPNGPPVSGVGNVNIRGGYYVNGEPLEAGGMGPSGPQGEPGPEGPQGPPGPAGGGVDFSLVEQDTGLKWLDGDEIFQKTVQLPALPNATTASFPHGIDHMVMLVEIAGVANNGTDRLPLPYTDLTVANSVPVRATDTDIVIESGIDRSAFTNVFVTLRYTKTEPVVETFSLFTDTPVGPSITDRPVTLGVKFRAAMDGVITAIRFYKVPVNDGPHTGILWASDGSELARMALPDPPEHGWLQIDFSTPVGIVAGDLYIASYHTGSGSFAMTGGFFNNDFVNGPLTAPSNASVGGNGVYAYDAAPAFPTVSFNASNYFVDLVFQPVN